MNKNKNKLIIISSVVAIVVVIGGLTIENIAGVNRGEKSIETSLFSALIPNVKDVYKVGETVNINGISMKINKIEISNGTTEDSPDEGTEYLIVTLTVRNVRKSKISYDGDDFQIQDAKGQINDSVLTMIDYNQTFRKGDLPSNSQITGTMTFLAVKGATGLSLNYSGDLFGHTTIHFKLN